jgi:hypothetical protein
MAMQPTVKIQPDGDVLPEVASDPRHFIRARVDRDNGDIYFECSSREALFDFGRALMCEAMFGSENAEFYPLKMTGEQSLVVNGVRLTEDSVRVLVSYPREGCYEDAS